MAETVAFAFKEKAEEQFSRGETKVRRRRLQGLVRLAGTNVCLEWSGVVEHEEVRGPEVHTRKDEVPITRVEVPASRVAAFSVRGRLRPRIELQVTDLAALAAVPTAHQGRVRLWIARADRAAAHALAVSVEMALADEAMRAAEGTP
jgi:hypothetical protein